MSFQQTVRRVSTFGFPGDIIGGSQAEVRSNPYVLDSTLDTNNVFGRAFTINGRSDDDIGTQIQTAEAGDTGTDQPFAGYLVSRNQYVLLASSSSSLAPNDALANNTNVALLTSGLIVVQLENEADPGDGVYFLLADGTLFGIDPAASIPITGRTAHAEVIEYQAATTTQPGLAKIHVDVTPPILAQT